MDALLLLHPIDKAIGREPTDRGDYFLDADGRARHRGASRGAPYLFASVSICDSRLFRDVARGRRSRCSSSGHRARGSGPARTASSMTATGSMSARRRRWPKPRTLLAMKGVFTIGIDRRFADELARGVLAEHGGDPLALARHPDPAADPPLGARAARGLPARVGRQAHAAAALAPLGDLDESEWDDAVGRRDALDPAARHRVGRARGAADAAGRGLPRRRAASPSPRPRRRRCKLARELASLLDELAIDGVPFDRARSAGRRQLRRALAAYAAIPRHRRRGTGRRCWPSAARSTRSSGAPGDLRARPSAGGAARRPRRSSPPARPARSPRRATCWPSIAALPQGAVVLPGLDRDIDEDELGSKLDPTHPQFGLRELLRRSSVERGDVAEWPGGRAMPARRQLIAELMRPAETTDAWQRPSPRRARACDARRLRRRRTRRRVRHRAGAARDAGARGRARRRWSRPTASSRAASPPSCGAGTSRSTIRPARRWPTRRRARSCCACWSRRSTRASRRSPCSPLLKHPLCALGGARARPCSTPRAGSTARCLRGLKPTPGIAGDAGALARRPSSAIRADRRAVGSAHRSARAGDRSAGARDGGTARRRTRCSTPPSPPRNARAGRHAVVGRGGRGAGRRPRPRCARHGPAARNRRRRMAGAAVGPARDPRPSAPALTAAIRGWRSGACSKRGCSRPISWSSAGSTRAPGRPRSRPIRGCRGRCARIRPAAAGAARSASPAHDFAQALGAPSACC